MNLVAAHLQQATPKSEMRELTSTESKLFWGKIPIISLVFSGWPWKPQNAGQHVTNQMKYKIPTLPCHRSVWLRVHLCRLKQAAFLSHELVWSKVQDGRCGKGVPLSDTCKTEIEITLQLLRANLEWILHHKVLLWTSQSKYNCNTVHCVQSHWCSCSFMQKYGYRITASPWS